MRALLRTGLVMSLVLIVLLCAVAVWSFAESSRWKQIQAAYVASGETLNLESLLPPPVADNDNFFALPELRDIALIIDGDMAKGKPAEARAALEALDWNKRSSGATAPPFGFGPENGTSTDIAEWFDYLREHKVLEFATETGNAGADIVRAIDRTFPNIVAMAAQSSRTDAQITPIPTERHWVRPLHGQVYAWPASTFALSRMFRLRAEVAAQANHSIAAFESLRVLRHLASAAYEEPYYIGRLVAVTFDSFYRRALWSALQGHCLNEEELRRLQEQMRGGRSAESLLYTLRTEMCFHVDTIDFLRGSGRDKIAEATPFAEADMPLWLARMLPGGWVDHNGSVGFGMQVLNYLDPLKEQGIPGLAKGMAEQERAMARLRSQLTSRVMLSMVVKKSPVERILPMFCSSVILDQQAVTAIALERFYFKNHSYPESLDQLVPDFMSAMPVDLMTGRPMGYRPTDDGRYMLWCVGFDGVDDDGHLSIHLSEPDPASQLYVLKYKGDWVWKYTPPGP